MNVLTPVASPGQTLALSADAPVLLHDLAGIWRVQGRFVDLFAVRLSGGAASGRRHFLLRLTDGMPLLGLGIPPGDEGEVGAWSILAVGGLETGACAVPGGQPAADAIDAWIRAFEDLLRDPAAFAGPAGLLRLAMPGEAVLDAGDTLTTQSQSLVWIARSPPGAGEPRPLTAITPWYVTSATTLHVAPTIALLESAALGDALAAWHTGLLARAGAMVDRRTARLTAQLTDSALATGHILTGGLSRLAGLAGRGAEAACGETADMRAIAQVAASLGHPTFNPVTAACALPPGAARIDAMLEEAGLRGRRVLLRHGWWRARNGPLVGLRTADDTAIALLPDRGGYSMVTDDATRRVDEAVAQEISSTAWMLYRAMPDTALGPMGLLRFSFAGGGPLGARLILTSLAAAILGLGVPLASGVLVEDVIPTSATGDIAVLAAGLAAAALGAAAVNVVRSILLLQIESRLDLNSQPALFDRMLRLPVGFFRQYAAGDLADRVMGVQEVRQELTGNTLTGIFAGLLSVVNLAVMLGCSVGLALAGLAIAALQAGTGAALAVVQLGRERTYADQRGRAESFVLQCLSGVAKLKTAYASDRAFALWARAFGAQRDAFLGAQRARALQAVASTLLVPLGDAVLFVVGAGLILHAPQGRGLSLGGWVAFSAAFGQLTAGLFGLVGAVTGSLGVLPLYERARPLLEARTETAQPAQRPGTVSGAIEFSGVTFGYGTDGPPVLADLSFAIRPGEFVAIVGPSGCGKSTILRLMLAFETPQSGEILFDGHSLAKLDAVALRRQIGVVLQNGRVQPGSLIENIGGGRPIALEDAWLAARLAGLDDDIRAMPMGMHTTLMDGGSTLSGGQRQRLMIARALARRPRILLLDEATSALDNRTQATVTEAVSALGLTRVVIAHRLSTIERVDRVLVLDGGRLVQSGGFAELAATPGLFQDLARRQLS